MASHETVRPTTASPDPAATRDVSRGLNPAQREAVLAPPGPLLVLAGAGTGKTRVVISRIAHLVRLGARPERILAVTFTNKAAREMLARARGLLGRRRRREARADGPAPPAEPEISTIHSLCVRILRRHAERLGYPPRFAIVDRGEQEATARRVLKSLRVAETVLRPGDLLDRVGRWKSRGIRPAGAIDAIAGDADDSWTLAAAAYRRYQEALKAAGAVDFDDLLLLVDELFTTAEDARRAEAGRFDHLLVDEYQDTSGIQERILTALARDHRSLCVVGDDDQSIYAWRGAEISHILDFRRRWPEARIVTLEENYRSSPEIIRAANHLIGHNARRHGKSLVPTAPAGVPLAIIQAQDEGDEGRLVVKDVAGLLEARQVDAGEAAILVRTGEQTRGFEQELRRRGIPYELVGSRSFFDRREVKDVMAFLRFMIDPDDDLALGRIANLPPRGISAGVLSGGRAAAAAAGTSLWRALLEARAGGGISNAARAGIGELERMLAGWAASPSPDGQRAAAALDDLLHGVGYRAFLTREYATEPGEAEARWACVEELAAALSEHEREQRPRPAELATTVRGFLDGLVLEVAADDRFQRDEPRAGVLRLMTLHAAKGLEFDCVWLVGLEEGLLPHHRALAEGLQGIDEERRLCYVGVTRARRRLVLAMCLTRLKWGKAKPCRPSRFLYELTGQPEKFREQDDRQPEPGGPRKASRPRRARR